MAYKKQRLGTKLLRAARAGDRYRDIHIFIGGTGAVGGTALLQMISIYEEMMSIHAPEPDDVPILVTTGRTAEELHAFTRRFFRFMESRHGVEKRPQRIASGYLTRSGIFVALERFQLTPLPDSFNDGAYPLDTLASYIRAARPMSAFLKSYQSKHFRGSEPTRFRSVVIGIPIPSLLAYHLDHLKSVAEYAENLKEERVEELRAAFRHAFREDLKEVRDLLADEVLVAHTTAVGGMYDEDLENGKVHRKIRLGFAHSAQDGKLVVKQHEAEEFAREYATLGIKTLITAAAIGIDEVRIRAEIPLHFQVAQKLQGAPDDLFTSSKRKAPAGDRTGEEKGHHTRGMRVIKIHSPLTIPLDDPPNGPARFSVGKALCPAYSIRSGENGFFTVSNADALYRVMRIASASELGLVLATVGIFGDDPLSPWFTENVCYYTETDNSRQVFDLLNQPPLLRAQLSGLEPLALQDLGSSKHQCELHTLSLLILLHRIRTLDTDAIDPYADVEHFDPAHFFIEHSRPLLLEDLESWHIDTLSREMQAMASAETPQDLLCLIPRLYHSGLFPLRDKALQGILEHALQAIWMVPSLGSPLVFERDGTTFVRTGFFVAPLDLLVSEQDSIARCLAERYERHQASEYEDGAGLCSFEEFRDFHLCCGGFVDLRPTAILCTAERETMTLKGRVKRFSREEDLRAELAKIEPYSFFTTSGLIALALRLKALHGLLQEAMAELGTLHEFRWQMPRDANGHIILVPGAVEAFRMFSEGLEKTTGTERLDGIWGYERRPPPDRLKDIPGVAPEGR
jgi:hypothetical protein